MVNLNGLLNKFKKKMYKENRNINISSTERSQYEEKRAVLNNSSSFLWLIEIINQIKSDVERNTEAFKKIGIDSNELNNIIERCNFCYENVILKY